MSKLKDFILSNKVFSKCSEQEQEAIISELERVEKLDNDYDLEWYKHEYYSECDRAENLENALDKACDELGFLGNNMLGKEQWKEWCLKDE